MKLSNQQQVSKTALRGYFFVCLLSLLPLISIFTTSDLPHTHDGLVHIPRIAAYFKALSDGQIPVRWAGDLNYGYGMPLFNFIYPLPYAVASVFIFLGAGLVNAFKLTLALSFFLSGIFMFLFAKTFLGDERRALIVALVYQFAPFHLVDLLVRGSFGEVYTYTFLPLVLFGLTKLSKTSELGYVSLTAFSTAFLVVSHNSVSLLFFGIAFGFVLLFLRGKAFLFGCLALLLGLLVCAFYWVPALFEHEYTYGDLFMKNLYQEHFAPFYQFFVPNLTNDPRLQTGSVSLQIGLFGLIAIMFSLWLLFFRKLSESQRKTILASIILIAISLFFTQPISIPFWEKISFLRQFQFPWRFLSVIVFATSMLSVSYLSFRFFTRQLIYGLLLMLIISSTVFYWRPSEGYDKINEDYYWNFPLNTTYYGETDLIWSAGPAGSYPKAPVELVAGEATISELSKRSNLHTFTVETKAGATLVDHTQFFPGWEVFVDGKAVPIQFQDPNWRGQITFPISAGIHSVRVAFGENKRRLIADLISLAVLVVLVALFVTQASFNVLKQQKKEKG